MAINNSRTMSQYDPSRGDVVAVLGVGALGSKVALELACLGVKDMMVYDFDIVEAHNLSNQAYLTSQVDMLKTDAITQLISQKTGQGCKVQSFGELNEDSFKHLHDATHIFLAFDSFEVRIMALKMIEASNLFAFTFDARLGAYHGNAAYVGEGRDVMAYREWLEKMMENRGEPETSACGLPISLGFTSSAVAGIMVSMFVNHCNKRLLCNATELNLTSYMEVGEETDPWLK